MLNGFCKALIYYVQLLFPSKCNHHLICVTPHIWYHVMYKYLFLGTLKLYILFLNHHHCPSMHIWEFNLPICLSLSSSIICMDIWVFNLPISSFLLDIDPSQCPDIWEFNLPIFSDLLDGVSSSLVLECAILGVRQWTSHLWLTDPSFRVISQFFFFH